MVETAREVGGAIGVAVVSSGPSAPIDHEHASSDCRADCALTAGFERATLVAAVISVAGAVTAGVVLRPPRTPAQLAEPTVHEHAA
jgi:hypothetical protein